MNEMIYADGIGDVTAIDGVASLTNGDFVACWTDTNSTGDGRGSGINAQMVSANDNTLANKTVWRLS